jgi:hypothetical protein
MTSNKTKIIQRVPKGWVYDGKDTWCSRLHGEGFGYIRRDVKGLGYNRMDAQGWGAMERTHGLQAQQEGLRINQEKFKKHYIGSRTGITILCQSRLHSPVTDF